MEGKTYLCKDHTPQGKLQRIEEDKISFQEYSQWGFSNFSISFELWPTTGKALVWQTVHAPRLKDWLSSSRKSAKQIHCFYLMVILKRKFQIYVFTCNVISISKILFWSNQEKRYTTASICQILSNGHTWKTVHRQITTTKSNKTENLAFWITTQYCIIQGDEGYDI